MWGSELIETARDFLEPKHKNYTPSARLGKGCASEESIQSIREVVSSEARL
jgi:hypothetical protein